MRVTENSNFDAIRENIGRSKGRMENLQLQHATLKKVNTPSDDPVGAAKVLEIRTDKVNNDQFISNANTAKAFLENSDHVLSEISDILARAKEIAIGQSSSASANEDTRIGIAEEVTQLYQQAVSAANRRLGDRYLFGGFKTHNPPVDPEGRYQGDDGQMMIEISRDVYIAMNVPGVELFNTSPKSSFDAQGMYGANAQIRQNSTTGYELNQNSAQGLENVNVFDELQNLRIGLLTGDIDGIRGTLDRFDQMHGKINAMRAKVGSRVQGLENTHQAMEKHTITNAQLTSTLEDADMAQVVSDMAKEETIFRSALQSSQMLVQPTLMQFLK